MSGETDWLQAAEAMLREGLSSRDAELREDAPESKCRPVKIHRTGKAIFISLNAVVDGINIKDRLFPLFSQLKGVMGMCDYWILYEHEEGKKKTPYIFLVELKSEKKDPIPQIENGKLLAEYFVAMVCHHKKLDPANVEFRALVFSPVYRPIKPGLRPNKPIPYQKEGRLRIKTAFLSDTAPWNLSALCD